MILESGVGKLGYDLYFVVIPKLLNNKYLRLFNFDFHTFINQRPIINYQLMKALFRLMNHIVISCPLE